MSLQIVSRTSPQSAPGPLERYIRILEALAACPDGLTSAELEQVLGLPKTTVNRLLHGLAASALIVATGGRNARFTLGSRLSAVLEGDGAWIETVTRRFLKDLSTATKETSFIARESGGQIRSVAMESPNAAVAVYVVPGHDLPRHATASGKLFNAFGNEVNPSGVRLERFTPRTIVNRRDLEHEYETIRRQGYATEREEHVEGLATVAVPILNSEGRIKYVLGLTGPAGRMYSGTAPRHLKLLRELIPQVTAVLMRRAEST
jgi:DNA-binding IclR family transcriptional regulator